MFVNNGKYRTEKIFRIITLLTFCYRIKTRIALIFTQNYNR
jgi:hypothetical protein